MRVEHYALRAISETATAESAAVTLPDAEFSDSQCD
jgi:hypothetical protein